MDEVHLPSEEFRFYPRFISPRGTWLLLMLPGHPVLFTKMSAGAVHVVEGRAGSLPVTSRMLDEELLVQQCSDIAQQMRLQWDNSSGLFTRKLGGSRHAHLWLGFSAGEIKLPRGPSYFVYSIVSIWTTPYIDMLPTIQHPNMCHVHRLVLTYLSHPAIVTVVWSFAAHGGQK